MEGKRKKYIANLLTMQVLIEVVNIIMLRFI